MKANRLRWFLPFLLGSAVFQLHAQPSEADRKMLTPVGGFGGGPLFPAQQSDPDYGAWLADVRAKAEKGDAQSRLGEERGEGSEVVSKSRRARRCRCSEHPRRLLSQWARRRSGQKGSRELVSEGSGARRQFRTILSGPLLRLWPRRG